MATASSSATCPCPAPRPNITTATAHIEERIKDAKLAISLRRRPLSDLDANRVWLHCSTLALNLLALLNDLTFGPESPGHLPAAAKPSLCAGCCSASPPA